MKGLVRVQAACHVNDNADQGAQSSIKWYFAPLSTRLTRTIVVQNTLNDRAFLVGYVQYKNNDAEFRQGSCLFF